MLGRIFFAMLIATTAFGQDTQELEKRVRALEEKVRQLQQTSETAELQREIDVLSREIEALKSGQQRKTVEAAGSQYGLGAAASKVYRSEPGVAFGGYGDMLYQNLRSDQPSTADLLRAVLYTGYKFNRNVLFNSELEVEHGSTEHGGQVSMEFAYLDYLLRPVANVRAGVVLIPLGFINEQHEPTAYFGARRPEVERRIIPTTWSEIGAGVFGDVGRLSYRSYVVTGLNSGAFEAIGIREGRQGGAEALAKDWAVTARADFHPLEGTLLGGAIYSGNSGQGRGFSGRVTLGDLHAEARLRGASARALWARGTIGDAAAINRANGLVGDESIGSSFAGWYIEGGYDLASLFPRGDSSLSPYARYERFDTQRTVPFGYERNHENSGRIFTLGVAFKPIPQTVIKVDWQNVNNRAGTGVDQFNVALGYIF
jgi:cell division protein FtsB